MKAKIPQKATQRGAKSSVRHALECRWETESPMRNHPFNTLIEVNAERLQLLYLKMVDSPLRKTKDIHVSLSAFWFNNYLNFVFLNQTKSRYKISISDKEPIEETNRPFEDKPRSHDFNVGWEGSSLYTQMLRRKCRDPSPMREKLSESLGLVIVSSS